MGLTGDSTQPPYFGQALGEIHNCRGRAEGCEWVSGTAVLYDGSVDICIRVTLLFPPIPACLGDGGARYDLGYIIIRHVPEAEPRNVP